MPETPVRMHGEPQAFSCCIIQLMAGGGVALIGITLVPLLSGLFV